MGYESIEVRRAKDKERYYKHRDRLLEEKRTYRLENIEKFKLKDKLYWLKNKEKIILRQKKSYEENKEAKKQYAKEYYRKNKKEALEWGKNYYKENRDRILKVKGKRVKDEDYKLKTRLWWHKRRALKKSTDDNTVNLQSVQELLEIQSYKCKMCGVDLVNKHLDHIKPLCVGGEHSIKNLHWLCAKCNLTKPKKSWT